MSRGWQIFSMITFALLAAALQIPEYLADLRKIDLEDETNTPGAKPKPYAAALDHAKQEGIIDENNQLQGPRSDFVRFCIANKYFHPYGREDWKSIDNLLKGSGGKPVTAEQLAQTFQDPASINQNPNNTMKQGFDGDRALYTLTLGEFFELLDQHLEASAYGANQRSDFPASTGRLVFGLKGIQELLGCSHKTAQYYKDHVIQEAVRQNGRKIVTDAELALQLFNQRRTAK